MSANRRKTFLVSAALVGGALLMTACQDKDSDAARGSSSTTPAEEAVTPSGSSDRGGDQGGDQGGGTDSGKQDPAAGTGSGENGGENGEVGKCRTDELEITAIDSTITGDPEGTVAVELKNGGGRDCLLSGYAGVDLKTGSGSLSAERTGEQATPVILKSGKSTYFGVNYPFNESGGSGVRVTGLLVTPPDETKSVTLDWPGAGTLPVTEGGGSQVKVGPMGSVGQGG